jgi:hypothetical protein
MDPRQEPDSPVATEREPEAATPLIDIRRALVLLAEAVAERGELASVDDHDLELLGHRGVRELYSRDGLPDGLTLGALAVFDAAQRAQDRGYAWGDTLAYAERVAVRFVDLIPDRAFDRAGGGIGSTHGNEPPQR